ncbi:hypothetical protein F5880DRAFT_1446792, partial [Lentinula raphanica]
SPSSPASPPNISPSSPSAPPSPTKLRTQYRPAPLDLSPTIGTARGKKRKLVINGVEENDVRAVQAVRIWCESFGEVKKFERRDNGSLVVDWRSKNVNDMVCRVQANVFIKGAGSVALSW